MPFSIKDVAKIDFSDKYLYLSTGLAHYANVIGCYHSMVWQFAIIDDETIC